MYSREGFSGGSVVRTEIVYVYVTQHVTMIVAWMDGCGCWSHNDQQRLKERLVGLRCSAQQRFQCRRYGNLPCVRWAGSPTMYTMDR